MRSAVESLPQRPQTDRGGGYYPGKFTEKMESRGLTVRAGVGGGGDGDGGKSYLQIAVQGQEGRRGKVLRSWTPWPAWTIR